MSTINSNFQALTSARNLDRTQEMLGRSLNRLSSGSRITSPADAPSGLSTAEKYDAQNHRVQSAFTNAQNAISSVQATDGFLAGMDRILSRLGELSELAQDPTKEPADLALYGEEFRALQSQLRSTIGGTTAEIGGIVGVTDPLGTFNGNTLFGGGPGLTLALGQNASDTMHVPAANLRDGPMGALIAQDATGAFTLGLSTPGLADAITAAIGDLAAERSVLGAAQSRLGLATASLQVERENLGSALSRIRDVDVAQESVQFAKFNILLQSGTAMLAQANQTPQSVLKLLQS